MKMSFVQQNYSAISDYLPSPDYLYDLGHNFILNSHKNRANDRLIKRQREEERKAQKWVRGVLTRLQAIQPHTQLKHFVIDVERDLGLSYGLAALFDNRQANNIKELLKRHMFYRPFWAKLEVGETGRVHIHLLAFCCPLKREGGQPVRSLPKIALYLAKPCMELPRNGEEYTREVCIKLGVYLWLKQTQDKRCPNVTFSNKVPRA
jgi:hypothetical protein